MSDSSKKCSKCLKTKPICEFQKHSSGKDGLRAACKTCCRVAKREARGGWAPDANMTNVVPDGFHVKGVSTLYDRDGEVKQQWVKSAIDKDHEIQALMDAMQTLAEPYKGLAKSVKAPKFNDSDLLAVYPLGDPHIGMHAWAVETGANFDLKIAEADLTTAVDHLVELAPAAKNALIVSLGDLSHGDSTRNETTKGTPVDVDTRWPKVLEVIIRTMRHLITRALEKHDHVTVIVALGNHDYHTSIVVGTCLANYYEDEPRVTIDNTPSKFHWFRFGSNLLGVHHGDTTKRDALPGVMACDRAKDWGETKHRMFMVGHIHHETVKEYPGVVVETFNTMSPKDAWHTSSGYRSDQNLKCDVWHRDHGRIMRHQVGVNQVHAIQAALLKKK